jgi:hypothetical protein
MSEPAQNFGDDDDAEDSRLAFFIVTPARNTLKWLPIKGYGLTASGERMPARNKGEDCDTGIHVENGE